MKRALIEPSGRIAEIVDPGDEFPVHVALRWVDVPDDTQVDQDRFVGGRVVKATPPVIPPPPKPVDSIIADPDQLARLKAALAAIP